ncbi:SurA N-terminal domain-containing protein [Nitratireductor thuwali]|uniref:Parvulin-like PPIase n=1 Tax=Nitratireductor thuwali TaxID=2267699 RepID=A0ABY5MN72_9HYPH|nr:Peptidyl-prolyl cis-trans isomerase D [Nitratireductor thuwali]
MLESLRHAATTWIAKLLLVLLVMSFAVWGISGQMFSDANQTVVTAGDTSVSAQEFRLAYDRQIAQISQQLGTRVTREQAVAFGLDNQVLAELAAGAALEETASEMNLGVSQQKVAEFVASNPAFQNASGRFDRRQFEFVLSQSGVRPEEYLRQREQAAVRQQIVDAVSGGISAPQTLLESIALYRGEDRTIEYVALPRSLVEPIEEPTGEELQSWFEENKERYAAPEYRQINYVKLEPEDIADPSVISDEQVRSYYEENKDRYTTAERRTFDKITYSTREEAETAREALRTGSSFDDLLSMSGAPASDVRFEEMTREAIADEAIAEAVYSVEEGNTSDVIDSPFGPALVRVVEVLPERAVPLEEVSEEIRQELALDEASRVLLDTYDAYEDARAGGQSMQEAAASLKLEMETVEAVDRTGQNPDGEIIRDLPASSDLISAAFDTEEGVENPPLNLGSNGFLFYEVADVVPARDRSLDEVREKVVADWKDERAREKLTARARELQEEVQAGKSLDEIASELGLQKEVRRGLKRQANDATIGRDGVAAVFSVAQGETGIFDNPAGDGQFLFKVTEVFAPATASADALPDDLARSVQQNLSNDLVNQLVTRLQAEHGVTVNQGAIQQALSF